MGTDKKHFALRITASRLDKGLFAVPQRFKDWFPKQEARIRVVFDDEKSIRTLTYRPHDPVVKENRIFGLGQWFSKRRVQEGDLVSITVEDPDNLTYRIALDRYVRQKEEEKSRQKLQAATTALEAEESLSALCRLSGKRRPEMAREELLRIADQVPRQPRPRVSPVANEPYEGAPTAIRVLLREVHQGECQVCAFTFDKRNGEPYFEIHHLDPRVGHHPTNLLVLCPNCHAQFEHARISDLEWAGDWLVGFRVNGKRLRVRQPLANDSVKGILALSLLLAAAQFARCLVR